jgi:hypothetical protein
VEDVLILFSSYSTQCSRSMEIERMAEDKRMRLPDQIIGADAHLQLVDEGWAVVRADHLKAMQDELDALPISTSRPRTTDTLAPPAEE